MIEEIDEWMAEITPEMIANIRSDQALLKIWMDWCNLAIFSCMACIRLGADQREQESIIFRMESVKKALN